MNTIKIIITAIIAIFVFDFIFFFAWALSGQQPVDGFYFGAITANILKTIIL